MTTDRAKREAEIVRTVWAVTLALVVGSFGFVVYAGGPTADETEVVAAAPAPLAQAEAPPAPGAVRVPVSPSVVSHPTEKMAASRPAVVAAPKSAAPKSAAPAAPAPRQVASVPGVSPAPAPAPRRVVVVRRSRAS